MSQGNDSIRLSDLSSPRQVLVRLNQDIVYGQILDLHVRDGEPVFDPLPTIVRDIRLDGDGASRPESVLADFVLRQEVCRLLQCLDELQNGKVQRIDVVAGIPRRILIAAPLLEVPR